VVSTLNSNSEINISWEKADYTTISIVLNYVWIYFECQYTALYNKGKGM